VLPCGRSLYALTIEKRRGRIVAFITTLDCATSVIFLTDGIRRLGFLGHPAAMLVTAHTHTHTQPFHSPLGFCPGLPGDPAMER